MKGTDESEKKNKYDFFVSYDLLFFVSLFVWWSSVLICYSTSVVGKEVVHWEKHKLLCFAKVMEGREKTVIRLFLISKIFSVFGYILMCKFFSF